MTGQTINLDNGNLTFGIKAGGEVMEWTPDLVEMKFLAADVSKRHNLEIQDDVELPTVAFLEDLAEAYIDAGCPACNPTVAHQIWIHVASRYVGMLEALNEEINAQ